MRAMFYFDAYFLFSENASTWRNSPLSLGILNQSILPRYAPNALAQVTKNLGCTSHQMAKSSFRKMLGVLRLALAGRDTYVARLSM